MLVIGGSRFVGPILLELLLKDKNEVTVFNRGNLRAEYKNTRFVRGDRKRGFAQLKGEKFDTVYDMCAYTGEDSENLLHQVKFDFLVHFGSVASYSRPVIFPVRESHARGEWSSGDYGRGKAECEAVLEKSGIKYATLRPTYILGDKNYVDREKFIYRKLLAGEEILIPGNGQALNQFVFSDEVAESLHLLGKKRAEGAFNCAGDDYISLVDLVGEMGRICGYEARIKFDPEHDGENLDESLFPFSNENFVFDNEKIKKKLGVKFFPLLAGLKRDWEKHYKVVC